jgi:hypothetical protein
MCHLNFEKLLSAESLLLFLQSYIMSTLIVPFNNVVLLVLIFVVLFIVYFCTE